MERESVVLGFNRLYLGDSVLEEMLVSPLSFECTFRFHVGRVLSAEGANIFEPLARYEPAKLRLTGVRRVKFEGGCFQFQSTIVDFGARTAATGGLVEFYLVLSGGSDPDAYLATIQVEALAFEFGP